jgi:hypothetical protein
MRGKDAASCWRPSAGQRGVHDCEVVIGADACHPPRASSVRFCVSISHTKLTVTGKGLTISWCPGEILQGRLGHEINDHPCELLASVFLEKMARALDNRVWLIFGARHPVQKDFVTPSRYGVTVAKGREERFFESGKDVPGLSIGGGRRMIRGNRHQRRKNARPLFI